jgi:hypothetical protein
MVLRVRTLNQHTRQRLTSKTPLKKTLTKAMCSTGAQHLMTQVAGGFKQQVAAQIAAACLEHYKSYKPVPAPLLTAA